MGKWKKADDGSARVTFRDNQIERELSNLYPAYITSIETVTKEVTVKGKDEWTDDTTVLKTEKHDMPILTDATVRIAFRIEDHISHVDISLSKMDRLDRDLSQTVFLRLDGKAIKSIKASLSDGEKYKELSGGRTLFSPEDGPPQKFFRFELQLDYQHVCAEGLFVDNARDAFIDLRNRLLNKDALAIYVLGSDKVKDDYLALKSVLATDLNKHPLDKWKDSRARRLVLQKGQMLEMERWPEYPLSVRYSFFDIRDYMVVLGYGSTCLQHMIEATHETFELDVQTIHLAEIKGSLHQATGLYMKVLMLMPIPTHENVRLTPGDTLKVCFDLETEEWNNAWTARVTNELPYSPVAIVTCELTRPWDKDKARFKDARVLPVIAGVDLGSASQFMEKIRKDGTGVKVKVKFESSDKMYSHNLVALEEFNKAFAGEEAPTEPYLQTMHTLLLGNRPNTLPAVNILEIVSRTFPNPKKLMTLDPGQSAAIDHIMRAPGGTALIQGPPGTGKTFLLKQLMKVFMADPNTAHHLLMLSATNTGVTELAVAAEEGIEELRRKNPKYCRNVYVVRVHNIETEKEVTKREARLRRPIPEDARPKTVADLTAEDETILAHLDMARMIREHHDREAKQKFAGIADKRVTRLDMSLGATMLRIAGVHRNSPLSEDPDVTKRFASFRESYQQYQQGNEFSKTQKVAFRQHLKALMQYTIRNATVVCTTVGGAGDPFVLANYAEIATFLAVDEAGRVSEPDWHPLLWHYSNISGRVLVGDQLQLPPVIMGFRGQFLQQLHLSFYGRLIGTGLPHVMLKTQYRMVPQIGDVISKVGYNGKLLHAPSTYLSQRPLAEAIRQYNFDTYGKNSNVIYFDFKPSSGAVTKTIGATYSRYNETFVKYELNLIEQLLAAFPQATIAVLTPYQANYRLLRAGKEKMAASGVPRIEFVDINKTDGSQGLEWDIVVADFPITDTPGFMRLFNRLNVHLSRAKNGLYLLAQKSSIDGLKAADRRYLSLYQAEYLRSLVRISEPVESKHFAEVDLTGAEEEGLVQVEGAEGIDAADSGTTADADPTKSTTTVAWDADAAPAANWGAGSASKSTTTVAWDADAAPTANWDAGLASADNWDTVGTADSAEGAAAVPDAAGPADAAADAPELSREEKAKLAVTEASKQDDITADILKDLQADGFMDPVDEVTAQAEDFAEDDFGDSSGSDGDDFETAVPEPVAATEPVVATESVIEVTIPEPVIANESVIEITIPETVAATEPAAAIEPVTVTEPTPTPESVTAAVLKAIDGPEEEHNVDDDYDAEADEDAYAGEDGGCDI